MKRLLVIAFALILSGCSSNSIIKYENEARSTTNSSKHYSIDTKKIETDTDNDNTNNNLNDKSTSIEDEKVKDDNKAIIINYTDECEYRTTYTDSYGSTYKRFKFPSGTYIITLIDGNPLSHIALESNSDINYNYVDIRFNNEITGKKSIDYTHNEINNNEKVVYTTDKNGDIEGNFEYLVNGKTFILDIKDNILIGITASDTYELIKIN